MKSKKLVKMASMLIYSLVLITGRAKAFEQNYVSAQQLSSETLYSNEAVFYDFWNALLWHVANHDDAFLKIMLAESAWFYRISSDVHWGLKELSRCAQLKETESSYFLICQRSQVAALAYGLSYIYSGYGYRVWDSSVGMFQRVLQRAGGWVDSTYLMTMLITFVSAISIDRAYLKYRGLTQGDTKKKLTGMGLLVLNKFPASITKRGEDAINKAIINEVSDIVQLVMGAVWFFPVSPVGVAGGSVTWMGGKSVWDIYASQSLYYYLVRQLSDPSYVPTALESYRFSGIQKEVIRSAFSGVLNAELFNQIVQAKLKVSGFKILSDEASYEQAKQHLYQMSYANHYSLNTSVGCRDAAECSELLLEEGIVRSNQQCLKIVFSKQPLADRYGDKGYILDICFLSQLVAVRFPDGSFWPIDKGDWVILYEQLLNLFQPIRVTTYTVAD